MFYHIAVTFPLYDTCIRFLECFNDQANTVWRFTSRSGTVACYQLYKCSYLAVSFQCYYNSVISFEGRAWLTNENRLKVTDPMKNVTKVQLLYLTFVHCVHFSEGFFLVTKYEFAFNTSVFLIPVTMHYDEPGSGSRTPLNLLSQFRGVTTQIE